MKKLILFVLFIFSAMSFALQSNDLKLWAHDKADSQYIHAYQDMYISVNVTDAYDDNITVDIRDNNGVEVVVITANASGKWGFVKGSNQFLTTNVEYATDLWRVRFVPRSDRSFQRGIQYTISVDVGDADPLPWVIPVVFNDQYVVETITINANSKYSTKISNRHLFKGGLNNSSYPDAGLSITGTIHYYGDPEVFPSSHIPLSLELFVSGDLKGVASIGDRGKFIYTNFSIPTSAASLVWISVDIDGAPLLDDEASKSYFLIEVDNTNPNVAFAALEYVAATEFDSEGTIIKPLAGYFNRITVSFNLQGVPNDSSGTVQSGISSNIWVVDPFNSSTGFFTSRTAPFLVTFSYNDVPLQGNIDLVVHVFDNVYNFVTRSVKVTIDVTEPNEFVVTVQPDLINEADQIAPEEGWYNDQTVSFSWAEPVDSSGILAYQFKSEGWSTWSALVADDVMLGVSQSASQAWVTVDAKGNNASSIWVRAIDRAGNIKTSYGTIKVDTIAPTISLQLVPDYTGKENVLVNILPQIGWYNDVNVKWGCDAEDAGQLRDKAFQYRYLVGTSNATTSDWVKIVSDVVVTPDADITNNVFLLMAVDKAGNMSSVTAQVFVDLQDPVPTNFKISFDACETKPEGVTPEAKWYNQATLDLSITWDSVVENGLLHRVMLYIGQSVVPTIQSVLEQNISFNNVSLIANDATPINFKALLVDKAGNFTEINDSVYSDIVAPNDFQVDLSYDSDSNNDGLDPELGYYDNPEITFMIMFSQADPTARNRPFQFKVNDNPWGEPTSNLYITNLPVSSNTVNVIQTRYIDRAGNILTKSMLVTVDSVPPLGSFTLRLITCNYVAGLQVTPDAGWYNRNIVSFSFYVAPGLTVADTFDVRTDGYFLKGEADTYFTNGTINSQNATLFIANAGALQRSIVGAISDRAGNIILSNTNVYVDTDAPAINFEARILADSDSGEDGIWPQSGWHATPTINLNWDQTNDGAGSLHNNPYRVRSDGVDVWSSFQYELSYSGIYVSPNNFATQNVYIQVRDRAGNLATKSVPLKVDVETPVASLFVSPQIELEGTIYSVFNQEYSKTFPLSGWLNTENVVLTWTAVDAGGFPSKSVRVKASTGQTEYSATLDMVLVATQVLVSANNHSTIDCYVKVWDNAGNSTVATRGIKVDIVRPVVDIIMRSQSGNDVMPFINSQDILYITLDVSEEIVVTPFVRYTISGGASELVTINCTGGLGRSWEYSVTMNGVLNDGVHHFSVLLVDDAGNIATTFNGYSNFFKLGAEQVPFPQSFNVQDIETGRNDLTNADVVSISFIVGTSINQYLILEGEDASSVNYAIAAGRTWQSLATESYVVVNGARKYLILYIFPKGDVYSINGLRTLHLWVINDKGINTMEAVTCSIVLDQSEPKVMIRPDDTKVQYEGLKLSKILYRAQMEITHNTTFSGEDINYYERAAVTPSWRLVIYPANDFITPITVSILVPFLISSDRWDATNENSSAYKAYWMATYNLFNLLGEEKSTYNAIFEVIVTDEAKNITTSVALGGSFVIDSTIPATPRFEVYSNRGNGNYTNSLTINYVLSRNIISDDYRKYYIFDNYYGNPRWDQYNIWPDVAGEYVASFSAQHILTDTSQGRKEIIAWVADAQTRCDEPARWFITYDSQSPTYETVIQPTNIDLVNPIVVTMFFNEQIDLSTTHNCWLVSENGSIVGSLDMTYLGTMGNDYLYRVTVDRSIIDTREQAIGKNISINVMDLAGNQLIGRSPFARPLRVLSYGDYFARGRSEHVSAYSFNNLEVGKQKIPVIYAELKASSRDVHVSGVNLQLDNMHVTKIEKFHIYYDQDKDGLFSESTDLLMASKPYQGVGDTMNISFTEKIVDTQTTTTVFLVVDVYSGADIKNEYIGFGFATVDAFNVLYYESVIPPANQPLDGIVASFNISKTRLNISYIPKEQDESLIVTREIHSGVSFVAKKFALRSWLAETAGSGGVAAEGALWTGLTLKFNYSIDINPTKITRVAIYKDNGNQLYDVDDLLVSSGTDKFLNISQTTINVVFPYPVNVGSTDPEFYVVVETDKTLGAGKKFSFEIVSADSFQFRSGDKMVNTGEFPVRTITFDSDYYVSKVSIETFKNPESYVYQDQSINLLKFKLSLDYKGSAEYPKLYYLDLYRDQGTLRLNSNANSDVEVKLYRYSGSQANDDYAYTEEVSVTQIDRAPSGERIRITLADSSNPQTNPRILATENYFALVIRPYIGSNVGKEASYKIKFVNTETASGNISFQIPGEKAYATILNEIEVTTNKIQVVSYYQPTRPIISGDAYINSHRNISFRYSTSVNVQNNGVDTILVKIGSTSGGSDIYSGYVSVNNVTNSKDIQLATVSITITDSLKFLADNTTYNISAKVKSTLTGTEYWSITGDFAFHTDVTPPWVGNDNRLHVIAKWDENRHDLIWSPFIEAESVIDYYIVEMLAGQSLVWQKVATKNANDREWSNVSVLYDTPYAYRVKAVNGAKASSEYLDSGDRIMTTNTSEVIFNVSNYPNPFYSAFQTTKIVFSLNQNIDASITIYDSLGHFVRRFDSTAITKEGATSGSGFFCSVDWDGRNESGQFVSKGGYFAVIEAAPFASSGKPTKIVRMIGVVH